MEQQDCGHLQEDEGPEHQEGDVALGLAEREDPHLATGEARVSCGAEESMVSQMLVRSVDMTDPSKRPQSEAMLKPASSSRWSSCE